MRVQLKDTEGKIVDEKTIVLTDSDMLVIKYDSNLPVRSVREIYKLILDSIRDGREMIVIPNEIQFEVIKTEK